MRKLQSWELGRPDAATAKHLPKTDACALLENVRSLMNVGSVFRSADAFGIAKLYLAGFTGTPPHREIHKTALGATESVEWEHDPNPVALAERLAAAGRTLIAVEHTDQSVPLFLVHSLNASAPVFVFGNEIDGVSPELLNLCAFAVEIPQFGAKHSINIAVAAGIVFYEYARPR
ncbi:MAG: TrmH family RNA methyltransferase [Bacteroidia bacterium]|nr:TrmH family RNA methyltransferase [Bacteroidia bacterium]MDW8335007.1 TrmH family RNA methyltransferase [Bacteroidia bacterium]